MWDLGLQCGNLSRLVAERARSVVALDAEHLAIERLYQALKAEGHPARLPLVGDLTDPSPDLGWRNLEREAAHGTSRPDLVLCLALVHHLVIGANIPLAEFLDWLGDLGADVSAIEFVTREQMVAGLLRNRGRPIRRVDLPLFERQFAARFTVVGRQPLGSATRILYHGRRSN